MKTVKTGDITHVVTYACTQFTVCGKKLESDSSFIEKKSLWEINCPKCKRILSPYKEFTSAK